MYFNCVTGILSCRFFDSLGGAVSVASYDGKAESDLIIDNEDFESASQVNNRFLISFF